MHPKKFQENTLVAYPAIFNLQEDKSSSNAERMSTLASLPQQEQPALLVIVTQPKRHIRVLWGIDKLPFFYKTGLHLTATLSHSPAT